MTDDRGAEGGRSPVRERSDTPASTPRLARRALLGLCSAAALPGLAGCGRAGDAGNGQGDGAPTTDGRSTTPGATPPSDGRVAYGQRGYGAGGYGGGDR
jgi:hypothetical protein